MCARFTHFLDSGEQGLTVIVLFNDIVPRGGGTYIAPDGIKNVVRWYACDNVRYAWLRELRMTPRLYEHPEGANQIPQDPDGSRTICSIQLCSQFVEVCSTRHDIKRRHS